MHWASKCDSCFLNQSTAAACVQQILVRNQGSLEKCFCHLARRGVPILYRTFPGSFKVLTLVSI